MGDVDRTLELRRLHHLADTNPDELVRVAATDADARRRREAEHELATDQIVEWCRARVRVLTAYPELEELLGQYEATRPGEDER